MNVSRARIRRIGTFVVHPWQDVPAGALRVVVTEAVKPFPVAPIVEYSPIERRERVLERSVVAWGRMYVVVYAAEADQRAHGRLALLWLASRLFDLVFAG